MSRTTPRRWTPKCVLGLVLLGSCIGVGDRNGRAEPDTAGAFPPVSVLYVSTAGSDTNDGSIDSPYRTIQNALDRVVPGQTVLVRGGTYNEFIEFRRSGGEGSLITLAGYEGEAVTLDGSNLDWRYGINLEGFDYITIQNLRVHNYVRDGLRGFGIVGWGDTDEITLRNIEVTQVETPIKFAANGGNELRSNITIENIVASDYSGGGIDLGPGPVANVTIRNTLLSGAVGGNDTAVDGIAVERGSRITIEGVILTGHSGDGIDLKADDVSVKQADVREFGRDGLKLWGSNAIAENCLLAGSRSGQPSLVLEGVGPYSIRHCLFRGGPGHSYTATIGPYDAGPGTPTTTVELQGNIFSTTGNTGTLIYFSRVARVESAYNIYYSPDRTDDVIAAFPGGRDQTFSSADINNGVWARAVGTDQTSRYADPMFNAPDAGDYSLRSGSPAIDLVPGSLAPPVDLLGRSRPVGSGAEAGPYEFIPGNAAVRRLSVSVKGEGFVSSNPAGIACPDDCSEDYQDGTRVSLSATPAAGWKFAKWRKSCVGKGDCTVTLRSDAHVAAKFKRRS